MKRTTFEITSWNVIMRSKKDMGQKLGVGSGMSRGFCLRGINRSPVAWPLLSTIALFPSMIKAYKPV